MTTLLEDRDEIRQLLAKYNHAIDSGDDEGWANLFTEDAVFSGGTPEPLTGREALRKFAASLPPGALRHIVDDLQPTVVRCNVFACNR